MIELKDRGSLLGLITGLRSTLQAVQTLFLDGDSAGYFHAIKIAFIVGCIVTVMISSIHTYESVI